MSIQQLLVVDDEANMRHMLSLLLEKSGYAVSTAANGHEALAMIRERRFDVVVCDIKMPEMDGLAFLDAAGDLIESTTVIMMSAYGTIDTALAAMKKGAYDYIAKPFKPDEVYLTLRKAEERERLRSENRQLKAVIRRIEADYTFGEMVGRSRSMHHVFDQALKAARFDTTVLIQGESGTGKELVARGIHQASTRSGAPLVTINCGGIPESLLESELFGYRRGAFTGADRDKTGLIQEADGGTLFLDEIGEMPLNLQVKLLRVLQEGEVRPVGALKPLRVDVRVLAATSKDLAEEVRAGRFREDLYYRLNVLAIALPPLRERPADIPLLAEHFVRRYNRRLKRRIASLSEAALAILVRYHWPGNVRELENAIERAVVLAEQDQLAPADFPEALRQEDAAPKAAPPDAFSLKLARQQLERRLIARALEATGGNRTHAARLLEISHPSLLSKMKLYGIAG